MLESPKVPLKALADNIQTLESPTVDRELARIEFKESPFYQNLLVSPDLKCTAIQVNFQTDKLYQELLARRNHFREKQAAGQLTEAEFAEYKSVAEKFRKHRDLARKRQHQDIAAIRAIMDKYREDADLFLGGVGMIADDMITFIKSDLKIFSFGVFMPLIFTLYIIFKKIRWIILPLLCCVFAVISMMGFLGIFGWEVTVISSNFISLQLIITMAIMIHLIVQYRELLFKHPEARQRDLILDTVRLKIKPCLYAALTSIAGFGSLLLCDILPVINFGWMMSAGIMVSLIVAFILFPAGLMLLEKETVAERHNRFNLSLTALFARFTEKHGTLILVVTGVAVVLGVIGISRLTVENSFINYFKDTTEIYQGMKTVDENLGGTTPLDVIIQFEEIKTQPSTIVSETDSEGDADFDEFDEFEEAEKEDKYWFTSEKMARVIKVHNYLERLPEIGKVLSLGTMIKIAQKFNDGKPLDNFQLALLYSNLPDKFKTLLFTPYVSIPHNEVRFSVRIKDSLKTLKRDALLKKIRNDLVDKLGFKEKNVHLTGVMVLYNNMLQSLFKSQILTFGVVLLSLLGMFLILFGDLKIALIALFPNLFASGAVLGVMGWLNIPLDMMTITIAAISIGIAVDNTIHYIHRFKKEIKVDHNYYQALHRCHGSIGHAMYYTTVTIIIGFSILVFSNFIPTIYFGLFAGLAMFIALIAALALLPQMLIVFKPFD